MSAPRSVTLHLRSDTPLSPDKLVPFIAAREKHKAASYALSPDGKLTRRVPAGSELPDGLAHADRMLDELAALLV